MCSVMLNLWCFIDNSRHSWIMKKQTREILGLKRAPWHLALFTGDLGKVSVASGWISSTIGMLPSIFWPTTASPATDTCCKNGSNMLKPHCNLTSKGRGKTSTRTRRKEKLKENTSAAKLRRTYHQRSMLQDELCWGYANIRTLGRALNSVNM